MGKPEFITIQLFGTDMTMFQRLHDLLEEGGVRYSRPQIVSMLVTHKFKTTEELLPEFRKLMEEISTDGRKR